MEPGDWGHLVDATGLATTGTSTTSATATSPASCSPTTGRPPAPPRSSPAAASPARSRRGELLGRGHLVDGHRTGRVEPGDHERGQLLDAAGHDPSWATFGSKCLRKPRTWVFVVREG